jgi:hypothetical protein
MKKQNLIICIFSLFFSCLSQAVELPRGLYSINDYIDEFRGPLRTKLEELPKNYITTVKNRVIEYTSHQDTRCIGANVSAATPLSKIQYMVNINPTSQTKTEEVIYQACGGFVTLVEYFHTTGDNLKESSIKLSPVV